MADGSSVLTSSSSSTQDTTTQLSTNRTIGQLLDTLASGSQGSSDILNSIAAAITACIIGGTTGGTANHILISKGTGGFALQSSVVSIDGSGNISGAGSIDGVVLATASPTKTLTVNLSVTLAGTDSTTMTFPSSSARMAALDLADQTLSGGANVTSLNLGTFSSGSHAIDCGACPLQYATNGGSFTLSAPSNDGSCLVLITNNGSAGSIALSGFTVGSSTGDAFTTINGNQFIVTIVRINGTSTYFSKALQ